MDITWRTCHAAVRPSIEMRYKYKTIVRISDDAASRAMPVSEIQYNTPILPCSFTEALSPKLSTHGARSVQVRGHVAGARDRRWDHVVPRAHVPAARAVGPDYHTGRGSPPTGCRDRRVMSAAPWAPALVGELALVAPQTEASSTAIQLLSAAYWTSLPSKRRERSLMNSL